MLAPSSSVSSIALGDPSDYDTIGIGSVIISMVGVEKGTWFEVIDVDDF
jgi:hypothetical protein